MRGVCQQECGRPDAVVVEKQTRPKPSLSPRPPPKSGPEEMLTDSTHGERNPRAWISLTTGQTGVGAPGRNGTPQVDSYIWKPVIG
jgi:hypothetical protein